MARENRRENRRAAREILEGDVTSKNTKEELKTAEEEQRDFFDETSDETMLDMEVDEDEENMNGNDNTNGEVEGEVKKATPAPSVQSGEEEDDGNEREVDASEISGEVELEGTEAAAAAITPEAKKAAEIAKAAADAAKPPVPAPEAKKPDEKKEGEDKLTIQSPDLTPGVLSNEEAAKLYGEWRGQTEELLASHHYRLDEKQVEELNANPAAIIPKLMSKVYMDSISAAFQQFTQYLPRMVGQVIEQRNSMNTAEKAFFDRWPALLDKRDTVLRLGGAYRASNPTASMEDFINEVGAQAMVALRLMPVSTDANANANGKKPAKKEAFKPAIGTPAPTAAPRTPSNPFENLVDEFTMSEEDMDEK